jgi:cation transport ATPase
LVACDGRFLGVIAIAGARRPEARQAIARLKGGRAARNQGDRGRTVTRERGDRIRALVAQKRTVAMIDDGVSDAGAR